MREIIRNTAIALLVLMIAILSGCDMEKMKELSIFDITEDG